MGMTGGTAGSVRQQTGTVGRRARHGEEPTQPEPYMTEAQRRANAGKRPGKGQLILGNGEYYNFNHYKEGLNDNVLVVGGSGTGKTRSIVRPNLLQAEGSYIVSDPKGNLYQCYKDYLEKKGYRVELLDFGHPGQSTAKYNFFHYIHDQTDVLKVAHMLCGKAGPGISKDPFWDQSAEILLECVIGYQLEFCAKKDQNFGYLIQFLRGGTRDGYRDSKLDRMLEEARPFDPDSLAIRCYDSIRMNPPRTWCCIVSATLAKFAAYDTKELTQMLAGDTVHFENLGKEKRAIFVAVSDTDRSMDVLANIFFSQAMQELCRAADERPDSRLPVPVRFILDDFATNVHIDEFPRMISSIRSRGISTMLIVQAEAQLESGYGEDAATIISNCDTYVYLGGNDIATARKVGERSDLPMLEILNMPVGNCWVFRRGQKAHRTTTFPLEAFEKRCFRNAARIRTSQREQGLEEIERLAG